MIQEKSLKLIKFLKRDLILKTENLQPKLQTFVKFKQIIPSALAFLVMKIKRNIQSMFQNNAVMKKMWTYY